MKYLLPIIFLFLAGCSSNTTTNNINHDIELPLYHSTGLYELYNKGFVRCDNGFDLTTRDYKLSELRGGIVRMDNRTYDYNNKGEKVIFGVYTYTYKTGWFDCSLPMDDYFDDNIRDRVEYKNPI